MLLSLLLTCTPRDRSRYKLSYFLKVSGYGLFFVDTFDCFCQKRSYGKHFCPLNCFSFGRGMESVTITSLNLALSPETPDPKIRHGSRQRKYLLAPCASKSFHGSANRSARIDHVVIQNTCPAFDLTDNVRDIRLVRRGRAL